MLMTWQEMNEELKRKGFSPQIRQLLASNTPDQREYWYKILIKLGSSEITSLNKAAMATITDTKPARIFDWTTSTDIETAVGEAVGAASVCWENLSGTGVFQSDRAKQIVDELVEFIRSKQPLY